MALALVAPGCGDGGGGGAGGDVSPPPYDYAEELAGAPPPLAALHERANELIDAGPEGVEQAIERLEGFPVVVNLWASWCGPCRAEFPHFQEVATQHGKRVAFLGLNPNDSRDAARTFLEDHPVPYPSYVDPDGEIAAGLGASFGLPATVFYDRGGERAHIKHGGYSSSADLTGDVRAYALGAGR